VCVVCVLCVVVVCVITIIKRIGKKTKTNAWTCKPPKSEILIPRDEFHVRERDIVLRLIPYHIISPTSCNNNNNKKKKRKKKKKKEKKRKKNLHYRGWKP